MSRLGASCRRYGGALASLVVADAVRLPRLDFMAATLARLAGATALVVRPGAGRLSIAASVGHL